MASIDPLYAQWLQGETLWAARTHAGSASRWGDLATTSERPTGIAFKADAEAQADRELAFFARGPFAEEVHELVGTDWQNMIGLVVTLTIDQLGYSAGLDVFVLEVESRRAEGTSSVTVLRPLGAGA